MASTLETLGFKGCFLLVGRRKVLFLSIARSSLTDICLSSLMSKRFFFFNSLFYLFNSTSYLSSASVRFLLLSTFTILPFLLLWEDFYSVKSFQENLFPSSSFQISELFFECMRNDYFNAIELPFGKKDSFPSFSYPASFS